MDREDGFGRQSGFRVFISSTTADLGAARAAIADYFRQLGADVRVQVDHPDTLNDGFAIKAAIDTADLNICLVGHCYGGRLRGTPPGENIPADASWTQWELLYAVERYRREHGGNPPPRPRLLIYFAGDRLKRPAEPEAQQALQAAFREKLKLDLRSFGGAFSWTFDSEAWLLDHVRHTVEGSNGLLDAVLDSRWEQFRQAYADACADGWRLDFPDGAALSGHGDDSAAWFAPDSPLFSRRGPLLIDTQRLAVIAPRADGMQLDQVADPLALAGEEIGFGELEAAFLGDGLAREALRPLRPAAPRALRLALVTTAGLGKTTTLRRLQHEINCSGEKFAVLLDAIDFRDTTDDRQDNLKLVIQRSIKGMGLDWTRFGLSQDAAERDRADAAGSKLLSPVAMISHGILEAAEQGRLVILIDGLDHVDTVPRALVALQQDEAWATTDVVVSGRPQPFSQWDEGESLQDTPDARYWRFAVPREVTADEAKAYLGGIGAAETSTWRYDLVSRNLGTLLFVPRVLAYVRTLAPEELTSARTSSDIYYAAIRYLLQQGLSSIAGKKAPAEDVERFLGLISALAFESMFSGPRGIRRDHAAPMPLSFAGAAGDANVALVERTRRFYAAEPGGAGERPTLQGDLRRLARLSTLVNNGLLDNERGVPETLQSVLWVNPTLQHFLAAYWLSKWAPGDLMSHAGGLDSDWFRAALFYPHASNSGATEEINRFLAEMPAACIGMTSWLCAARAWYDPDLVRGPGRPGLWSTEMIARSWRTLHALADRPVDDWWDISYESLCAHRPGTRSEADLHRPLRLRPDDRIIAAASAALDGFLGDFEAQLAVADPGSPARRFVEDDWIAVPAGALDPMGSPIEQQGFPPRTLAYWKQQIPRALDAPDLAELARRTSPDSWWTGPYGRRQREEEVDWLVDKVFRPYAEASRQGPAALAAAQERALDALRDNFRRPDETPEEAHQPIAAFTCNALPMTNAIFALFSPGHLCDIAPVVARNQESQHRDGKTDESRDEYASSGWDTPDRPTVYVSWFDAWAFAQWARWTSDGVRYACRLPHEPEWEYACKRCEPMQDPSQRSLFGQLYWWGNDFYDDPDAPREENKSTPRAHAVGWPGATRPPRLAAPNGFGFKDMIGNTWEWCANVYDLRSEAEIKEDRGTTRYSRHRPATEPPRNNAPRSMRGGIWYYMNHIATASNRFRLEPADADYKTGFRLVREILTEAGR